MQVKLLKLQYSPCIERIISIKQIVEKGSIIPVLHGRPNYHLTLLIRLQKTISKHGWIMLCTSLAPCTMQVDGKTPTTLTTVTSNYQTSHSSTTVQCVTACTWYREVYVNFSSEHLHFFLLSLEYPDAVQFTGWCSFTLHFRHTFEKYFTLHFLTHTKQHMLQIILPLIWNLESDLPLSYITYVITISIVKN